MVEEYYAVYYKITGIDLDEIIKDIDYIFRELNDDYYRYNHVIIDFNGRYIGKPLVRRYVKLKNKLKEDIPRFNIIEANMNESMKQYYEKVVEQFSDDEYEPSSIDAAGLQEAVRRMHREFEILHDNCKCSLAPILSTNDFIESECLKLLDELTEKANEFDRLRNECEEIASKMHTFLNVNMMKEWLRNNQSSFRPWYNSSIFPRGVKGR